MGVPRLSSKPMPHLPAYGNKSGFLPVLGPRVIMLGSAPVPYKLACTLIPVISCGGEVIALALVAGTEKGIGERVGWRVFCVIASEVGMYDAVFFTQPTRNKHKNNASKRISFFSTTTVKTKRLSV